MHKDDIEVQKKRSRIVYLDLINVRWPHLGIAFHFFQMLNPVITHSNTPSPAFIQQSFQRLPELFPSRRARSGAMNQEQIDKPIFIVAAAVVASDSVDTLHNFLISGLRRSSRTHDLGSDKDILSRQTGLSHRLADFFLVTVELCSVNVSIPRLESC